MPHDALVSVPNSCDTAGGADHINVQHFCTTLDRASAHVSLQHSARSAVEVKELSAALVINFTISCQPIDSKALYTALLHSNLCVFGQDHGITSLRFKTSELQLPDKNNGPCSQ
jgi:hypothetical protein